MTSSPHDPYVLGYTRATMAGTERCETATLSKSLKAGLSSDWSLKLDSMKVESLVIAHQNGAVNSFPGLVHTCLLYTSPSPRDRQKSRMPSSA